MSRIQLFLPAALLFSACVAPGLKNIPMHSSSTGDSDSTTTGESSGSTSGEVMTTTDDEGSGTAAHSGTTSTSSNGDPGTTTTTTTTTTSGDPVCGDGVVDGDEECDDGNDIVADRCHACTKNRWIFATAALHNDPTWGGIDGADSLCRQYALQSGRADDSWKTFIAWMSDADHDVRDRLYPGRGRYVRTDGVVVAKTVEQFFSGQIDAPINVDEHGNQDIGGGVATGTLPDGTAAPGTHCDNWTQESLSDFSAYMGAVSSTNERWTSDPDPEFNPQRCFGLNARFYCIEGE